MSLSRPTSIIGGIVAFVFVFAFVGVISSCLIALAIWPGEIKLLAPIFCTDAQPDAFVVADTYSPRPGETVTNFSLYCMGPRGDSTDHGFLEPFLLISVFNGIVLMAVFFVLGKLTVGGVRRARRRGDKIPPIAEGSSTGAGGSLDPEWTTTSSAPGSSHGPFSDRPSSAPPGSTPGPFVD